MSLAHQQCTAAEGNTPNFEDLALHKRDPSLKIFVSFSMPKEILKILGKQLTQLGGQLVFRGLPQNSFKEFSLRIRDIGVEAVIDSPAFQKYNIKQVPTFVFEGNERQQCAGNVSLQYVLEKFAQIDPEAQKLVNRLKVGKQ